MHPHISILTIFLSFLMTYRNWNINRNTIFLSGFIFVFTLYSLIHYILLIHKDVFLLAVFYNNNAPIGFLVGPLLYFYVRGTLYDNKKLTKKDLLHLLPAFINFISITPYLLTPFSYKYALAERLVKDITVARTVTVGLYPNIINMIARPTLLCIYTILSFVMLYRFYVKTKSNDCIPRKQTNYMMVWLFSFLTIIFFAMACFVVLSYLFLKDPNPNLALLKTSVPMNIVSFCLLMIPVSLLLFPEILYGIPQIQDKTKVYFALRDLKVYERINTKNNSTKETEIANDPIKMHDIDFKKEDTTGEKVMLTEDDEVEPRFIELSESIIVHVKESKIFLNPNFSMEELSRSMNVPKHHLYYCFNKILKIKLTKLRAELRVEYAKKLIDAGLLDLLTLDAIGKESGFSSRSSFQSTFKDEVGCTPGEYFKKIRSQN